MKRAAAFALPALFLTSLIVLDSAAQPGWTDRIQGWAIALASLTLVYVTWLYVRETRVLAGATAQLTEETKRQRLETSRPKMRTIFDFPLYSLVMLVVENVGTETATDFRMVIEPPLLGLNRDAAFMSLPLFTEGAAAIGAGVRIEFPVGTFVDFLGDDPVPTRYVARVSYGAPDGRRFDETNVLDLAFVRGSHSKDAPHEKLMAESLKKIAARLDRAADPWTNAIVVATPAEVERIARRRMRDIQRQRKEAQAAADLEAAATKGDVIEEPAELDTQGTCVTSTAIAESCDDGGDQSVAGADE